MPIIGIKKSVIDRYMGKVYTENEFGNLLFDYGLELDEVTSEKVADQKEKGIAVNEDNAENLCDDEVYKIELPANRYDLLCVEGLTRALRIFKNEMETPIYKLLGRSRHKIIIKPEVLTIRPFVVAAVLIDVRLDADSYTSLVDLQDKLHQNICRKRTLVAIGTHDLDTVQGPFYYGAEKPTDLRFKPLNGAAEYTAEELMVMYSTDSHLKSYLPIIINEKRYPVIRDTNGVVLSMPPIINGDHSKIKLSTRNILVEVTATDLEKAKIVLNTIVAMFSQYTSSETGNGTSFIIEPVEIITAVGSSHHYPDFRERIIKANVGTINSRVGLNLKAEEMCALLKRMSLKTKVGSAENCCDVLEVHVPITRTDILHECDVAEDVAIAYGFNQIAHQFPETYTIGEPFPLNKLTDLLRYDVAAAGWTETLNFALCSRDVISVKLRKPNALKNAVKILNPKTSEFQAARTSLLPGLLKTLASNKDMPLPLRLFEIQDVILKDSYADIGARNERRLCAVYCSKSSGFEIMHGLLDRIMQLTEVKWNNDGTGYFIVACDDPTYLNGRCAAVVGPGGMCLGTVGVLHPDVITNFGLTTPISVLDINIEPFL